MRSTPLSFVGLFVAVLPSSAVANPLLETATNGHRQARESLVPIHATFRTDSSSTLVMYGSKLAPVARTGEWWEEGTSVHWLETRKLVQQVPTSKKALEEKGAM